jgi:hypothetical protein
MNPVLVSIIFPKIIALGDTPSGVLIEELNNFSIKGK